MTKTKKLALGHGLGNQHRTRRPERDSRIRTDDNKNTACPLRPLEYIPTNTSLLS